MPKPTSFKFCVYYCYQTSQHLRTEHFWDIKQSEVVISCDIWEQPVGLILKRQTQFAWQIFKVKFSKFINTSRWDTQTVCPETSVRFYRYAQSNYTNNSDFIDKNKERYWIKINYIWRNTKNFVSALCHS